MEKVYDKTGLAECKTDTSCEPCLILIQVTVEYKLQHDTILFGVHQAEQPTSLEISVTVTSPAMKVIGLHYLGVP